MHLSVQQMTSLTVSVLVLGIGIARHQSIGYWVLGAKLGIVLTLIMCCVVCNHKLYNYVILKCVYCATAGSCSKAACLKAWWRGF